MWLTLAGNLNTIGLDEFKAAFGVRLPNYKRIHRRCLAGNAKHDSLWQTGCLWQDDAGTGFGHILDDTI
jgi:hypothetical protein